MLYKFKFTKTLTIRVQFEFSVCFLYASIHNTNTYSKKNQEIENNEENNFCFSLLKKKVNYFFLNCE